MPKMAEENENEPLINIQEDSSGRGSPTPPSLSAAQLPSIPTEGKTGTSRNLTLGLFPLT